MQQAYVDALNLSAPMRRDLIDVLERGPYWQPQNRGELSVARALNRRKLLTRLRGVREEYELNDAGREVAEHLKATRPPKAGS